MNIKVNIAVRFMNAQGENRVHEFTEEDIKEGT